MAVDADLIARMYTQISLGAPKDQFAWPLSKEASVMWDQIEREVAAIKADGRQLEAAPVEVPDIPPWVAEAPEAQTADGGDSGGGGSVTLPVAGSQATEGETVPWSVRRNHGGCSGYAVVNDDTGKLAEGGCHGTKAKAEAHKRALYANTKEEQAVTVTADQLAKGRRSEDDDCPPGQTWDPDAEECVDADETSMAAEDTETAGGDPNPGTGKDGRLKGRKGPERRSKKRDKMAANPDESAEDGAWQGILTVEGIPTGDGREFAPDSLVFAELPLPLTYQPPTHGGDAGPAIDVGVIDEVWRDETEPRVIRGRGRFDMKDPVAADYHRKVDEGFLRGMSVDLDDLDPITDVELSWSDAVLAKAAEHGIGEDEVPMMFPPSKKTFHKARVRGAALLSMPAFVEAQMVSAGKEPPPLPDLPVMEEAARAQEAEQNRPKEPAAVTAAAVARLDDFRPPVEWFQNPQLGQQTPITITDDMRVYGHAFQWKTCHIGYNGQCVMPPEEEDFPFYTQGEVICAGGERVAVGAITLGMGHASTDGTVSARAAAEHYDNTDSVVADVAIGCDRIGGWVAGCIRPGTDPQRVYALRASGQVSGDWRYIGGRLRLVALLAVNVPGFPVTRPTARVAGGQIVAMTAAGMLDVGPRIDWEAEIEQRALRSIRDKALAAFND